MYLQKKLWVPKSLSITMSPFIFTNKYRWQPVLKGQAYEKQFHVWYDYAAVLLLTLVSDIDTWGEKWDAVSKTLINSDCELFHLLAQRKELCEEDVFWKIHLPGFAVTK